MPEELTVSTTDRGFPCAYFLDYYKHPCYIQKSSLADEHCIWLGVVGRPMHLNSDQVAALLPLLIRFVETGEIQEVDNG